MLPLPLLSPSPSPSMSTTTLPSHHPPPPPHRPKRPHLFSFTLPRARPPSPTFLFLADDAADPFAAHLTGATVVRGRTHRQPAVPDLAAEEKQLHQRRMCKSESGRSHRERRRTEKEKPTVLVETEAGDAHTRVGLSMFYLLPLPEDIERRVAPVPVPVVFPGLGSTSLELSRSSLDPKRGTTSIPSTLSTASLIPFPSSTVTSLYEDALEELPMKKDASLGRRFLRKIRMFGSVRERRK